MRTPGHDLELARGLLHAESVPAPARAGGRGRGRARGRRPRRSRRAGSSASAAGGVCGRVAVADLERRAREVTADTVIDHAVLTALPGPLRAAQSVVGATGGLHAAGLFTAAGALVAAREDVGRHNAVDKLVGWALGAGGDPARHVVFLSGWPGLRAGPEGHHVRGAGGGGLGVELAAIELAERFGWRWWALSGMGGATFTPILGVCAEGSARFAPAGGPGAGNHRESQRHQAQDTSTVVEVAFARPLQIQPRPPRSAAALGACGIGSRDH